MVEQNKRLVESFFANMTAGKVEDAFAVVADDVAWWVPGQLPFSGTKDKAGYLRIVRQIQTGFPQGLAFQVHGMTAEDDRVAAEVVSTGEHVNGKRYNNHYHFLFTLIAGQIVAVREYMDTQHLKDLIS